MLSEQALQQLHSNFRRGAAAATVDPSTLPLDQQLPQVIKLLTSKPLVRGATTRQPLITYSHTQTNTLATQQPNTSSIDIGMCLSGRSYSMLPMPQCGIGICAVPS